jgi:hypothetical protein
VVEVGIAAVLECTAIPQTLPVAVFLVPLHLPPLQPLRLLHVLETAGRQARADSHVVAAHGSIPPEEMLGVEFSLMGHKMHIAMFVAAVLLPIHLPLRVHPRRLRAPDVLGHLGKHVGLDHVV